jgi:AGZA family xanthine/uracil permease-like MFS transporter
MEAHMLERIFHLSKNETTIKTEIVAGITTFLTMAYILVVNPDILSKTGMPISAVL